MMRLTSTQFVAYSEIDVKNTDLFEDAFGITSEFTDVIAFLKMASFEPQKDLLNKLSERIRTY
jgi:hypothetical protein